MFVTARFDPAQWLPRPGEGVFEYWASLTPMAPVFGVPWRFGDIQTDAPLIAEAPFPRPVRADVENAETVETPALDEIMGVEDENGAGEPDDLTRIKGIGPKMAERLEEAGVNSFASIAAWTDADVEAMEASLGGMPGAIERQDWVGQAKALAD